MLADADILAGKVALGRGYVSRDAASRIAAALVSALRQGHPTSFASAGVRLGLLPPQHAEALSQTLEHGALVCRGTCGRVQPLRTTRAHETLRCVSCGGPVYVGARPGQTGMELDVPPAGREGRAYEAGEGGEQAAHAHRGLRALHVGASRGASTRRDSRGARWRSLRASPPRSSLHHDTSTPLVVAQG